MYFSSSDSMILLFVVILFPLAASLILLVVMFMHRRGDKAIFSLLMILLFLYIVALSFDSGTVTLLCFLLGPWLICITMFLTYLSIIRKKSDVILENESNHSNDGPTSRVLDPCLFYGKNGRRLTYEDSLDHLSLFDINDCNEFLNSIGYPLPKKGESLDQSRQRCIDAYKKEYIKYS